MENLRWSEFVFRPDDIVIIAEAKSGTTWTQHLVANLIFNEVQDPISELSPWLDMTVRSTEAVFAIYESQRHRRFIKTHTPLDGVLWSDDVSYVCVGREPRDAAVSFAHHFNNMDTEGMTRATDSLGGTWEPPPDELPVFPPDAVIREWLDRDNDGFFLTASMYQQMWQRRHLPNVELFHFADYRRDLAHEVRRLASFLHIDVTDEDVQRVMAASSIDTLRSNAANSVPEGTEHFKDAQEFFRSGSSGQWRDLMTPEDLDAYAQLLSNRFPPDLVAWVTNGRNDHA